MKKSAIILLLFVLSFCFVLTGCSKIEDDPKKTDPYIFYVEYMDLLSEKGLEKAQNYRYYADEDDRELDLALGSDFGAFQYEVIKFEKINNELYAFTYLFSSRHLPEGMSEVLYNFVGVVDGKYKSIANVEEIPDYLREGLVEENFSY